MSTARQAPPVNLTIELLRGIAAVMVMLCHYAVFIQGTERNWLSFLYTGVDFFFVISGFVFAPLLFAPARENSTAFVIRRTFRIYPLFAVAVLCYALLPHKTWDHGIIFQHLLFLHTTISKEIAFFYNPAFWTLPVEVEFYLFLTLLIVLKLRNTLRLLSCLFGLSVLTILATHFFLAENSYAKLVLMHHLPTLLPEFLLGVLAYHISKNCSKPVGALYGVAGLLLIGTLAHGFVVHGNPVVGLTYGLFNLLCALGYQWIIIACVTLSRNTQPGACFTLLASLMGNLSYGVYLFHNAIPPLLNIFFSFDRYTLFVTSILVTMAIALLLYTCLENPMREFGRRYAARFYHGNKR